MAIGDFTWSMERGDRMIQDGACDIAPVSVGLNYMGSQYSAKRIVILTTFEDR